METQEQNRKLLRPLYSEKSRSLRRHTTTKPRNVPSYAFYLASPKTIKQKLGKTKRLKQKMVNLQIQTYWAFSNNYYLLSLFCSFSSSFFPTVPSTISLILSALVDLNGTTIRLPGFRLGQLFQNKKPPGFKDSPFARTT